MDRLNNITGRGADGFPISTEVVKVLSDYQDFIHAILDSLGLPTASCVFLNYDFEADAIQMEGNNNAPPVPPNIKNAMVYVVHDSGGYVNIGGMHYYAKGKLYRLENYEGANVAQLVNGEVSKSIQIIQTPQAVVSNVMGENGSGEGEMIWEDVYYNVRAKIINPDVFSSKPAYKFYTLADLIDIDNYSPTIYLQNVNSPAGVVYEAGAPKIIRKNNNRIKLAFTLDLSGASVAMSGITVPLFNGSLLGISEYRFIAAGTSGALMCVLTPTNIEITPIAGGNISGKIYVNHTIYLK